MHHITVPFSVKQLKWLPESGLPDSLLKRLSLAAHPLSLRWHDLPEVILEVDLWKTYLGQNGGMCFFGGYKNKMYSHF